MPTTDRLTTPQVLALAGYSRATLRRRMAAGRMPEPIDRCGSGGIYDGAAVRKALGLEPEPPADPAAAWDVNPDAIREARARRLKQRRS